jgi:hypothetical protein
MILDAILAVGVLQLVVAVADLFVDLRGVRPVRRRRQMADVADTMVAAAEQRFGAGHGSDKARWARERVIEVMHCRPTEAEALVEFAVAKAKGLKR